VKCDETKTQKEKLSINLSFRIQEKWERELMSSRASRAFLDQHVFMKKLGRIQQIKKYDTLIKALSMNSGF